MKKLKRIFTFGLLVIFLFIPLSVMGGEEKQIKGKGKISGDIFGKRGRYYHAFLSLYGAYDDNIFNTGEGEESDFITVISPGILLAFPATRGQADVYRHRVPQRRAVWSMTGSRRPGFHRFAGLSGLQSADFSLCGKRG